MKKPTQSNWLSALLALMFALLLFFNANAQNNLSSMTGTNSVYDETVYNVPVHVEYDQEKYFVSGYEETVSVHLSSANRIQLNMEANEDTRNFQVVADLTKTPLGTSEIQLRVKGLSTAVTAEIEPKTITVTIENKVTKTVDVEAKLPDSVEAEGYKVDTTEITPKTVKITTGEETAKAIERVVAPIANVKPTVDTIEQTVNVQALDSKGQVLSIENPAPQVNVVMALTVPSKEVGLSITQTGTPPSSVSNYTFSLSKQSVEIKGPKSVLNTLDLIELPIDISSIRSTTKQKVTIPTSSDYVVSPSEVEVTITPIVSDSTTEYSGSFGQGSGSSNNVLNESSSSSISEPNGPSSSSSSSSSSNSSNSKDSNLEDSSSSTPNG